MEESIQESALDMVSAVKDTINALMSSLFDSIRSTIFPLLDDIVFIGNDVTEGSYFEKIFGTNLSSRCFDFSQFSAHCLCFVLWSATSFFLYRRERN